VVLAAVIGAAVIKVFFASVRPSIAWDADTYHLTVPRLYIENGGFRPIRFNIFSNWPLGIHLLFGLAMQMKDYVLAKLVHLLFGCLTLLSLYRFGRVHGDRWTGLVAAMLFLGIPAVLSEFSEAYVDIAFAFFFFLGFWYLLSLDDPLPGRHLRLLMVGICAGLLVSTKLTGWWAVACLGVLYLWNEGRRQPLAVSIGEVGWTIALPCLAMAMPWWIKSYAYTGNPVYPFAYRVFGGADWSPELSEQFRAWMQSIGMGRGVVDYLLLPLRVILESGPGYAHFGDALARSWIVLLPLIAACGIRFRTVRCALLVALPYSVFWAISSQQTRFLIPVLPLLSAAGALSLGALVAVVPIRRARWICTILVILSSCAPMASGPWQRLRTRFAPAPASTGTPQQASPPAIDPVYTFINTRLPSDARILFLNTNHGFFCHRDFVADSSFEASQLGALLRRATSSDELRRLLGGMRITHILWKCFDWGIVYPHPLYALLDDPNLACPVFRSSGGPFILYELRYGNLTQPNATATTVPRAGEAVGTGR
jgi:hypothetical protein